MGKRKDYTPELKDIAVYAERGSFSYVTYSSTYYVVVHHATGIEVNGRRELCVEHALSIAAHA